VKVEVLRLRKAFRELFREEMAHTVAHVGEIEEEIRHLFTVLRRSSGAARLDGVASAK